MSHPRAVLSFCLSPLMRSGAPAAPAAAQAPPILGGSKGERHRRRRQLTVLVPHMRVHQLGPGAASTGPKPGMVAEQQARLLGGCGGLQLRLRRPLLLLRPARRGLNNTSPNRQPLAQTLVSSLARKHSTSKLPQEGHCIINPHDRSVSLHANRQECRERTAVRASLSSSESAYRLLQFTKVIIQQRWAPPTACPGKCGGMAHAGCER